MQRISTITKVLNLFGVGKHGFRDGDMATNTPPTDFNADWCNSVQEELATVIEGGGLALNPASNSQLFEAVQRLIDAQSGNYALDTGAVNAYVVALNPAVAAYANGMTVRFRAVNTNTAASTLNAGAGAVPLVNDVGADLLAGDCPAGGVVTATYYTALNKFLISSLVPSQAMSQVAADARYAQIARFQAAGIPTGALNGVNQAYVLPQAPVGSVPVYINGLYATPTVDYTIAGATITHLGTALAATDTIAFGEYRY